jgi:hypothetical protein
LSVASVRGHRIRVAKHHAVWSQRSADLVEDIEFLVHPDKGGVRSPVVLLARLGYRNPLSLARRLYRWGYSPIANVFERDDFLTREPWELLRDKIGADLTGEDHGRDSLQPAQAPGDEWNA